MSVTPRHDTRVNGIQKYVVQFLGFVSQLGKLFINYRCVFFLNCSWRCPPAGPRSSPGETQTLA